MILESTGIQLRVPYNTLFNVNILSIDPCGQNSVFEIYYGELKNIQFGTKLVLTLLILFHYFINFLANCGTINILVSQIDESITIHGFIIMNPAIEGTNVTFHCPHGLLFNGPNTSTCMGSGEWEPDPQKLRCLGDYVTIKFSC